MDNFFKPLTKKKKLVPGTIIRRIGGGKDQQGGFLKYDKEGNMLLTNIIDMAANTLYASRGVLKPKLDDKLYYYESTFNNSPSADKAIGIIKKWSLFQDHREIQDQIINFISITYAPE